jgi:hypothetical protein
LAGAPKKQLVARELEQRTRVEFPDEPEATHLDYVEYWQSCGKTLNSLAEEMGLGQDNGEFITRCLRKVFGTEEVSGRLERARARGAHFLIEQASTIADQATEEGLGVARLRVQNKQWTAEKWNAREFGGRQGGATVNISIGTLHLDALQTRRLERSIAITSAIDAECEIVSSEVIEG